MPAMDEADHPVPHVAIFPSPGVGHLTPMLALGSRLVSVHGLCATVFVVTTGASAAQSHLVRSAAADGLLRLVELPSSAPLDASSTVEAAIVTRISVLVRNSLPPLRSALQLLPLDVLVVDIFGTDAFDVADELGMSKYLFFTSPASVLALCMHLPAVDRDVVEGAELADLPAPGVRIPGCKRPVPAHELISTLLLKRTDDGHQWFLRHCRRFPMARGIMVNTCAEMEAEPLAAMAEEPAFTEIPTPRVYPVGPLIQYSESPVIGGSGSGTSSSPAPAWLQWLDSQPEASVLYVSFGSGGTLSVEQTAELAWGLERSGRRFLWVIRRPEGTGRDSSAAFFTCGAGGGGDRDVDYHLPEGFTKRTEGRGFLLPSWAPQVAILRHPAVGGFMTHGGWNSILESLAHGVPMAVWPLYAEQRMNAAKLEEELGVAVRVRAAEEQVAGGGGGTGPVVIGREEVERVATVLMAPEGEARKAMKARAAELRECFAGALDEGGSSRSSLAELVVEWTRIKQLNDAYFRRHLDAPCAASAIVSSSTVR